MVGGWERDSVEQLRPVTRRQNTRKTRGEVDLPFWVRVTRTVVSMAKTLLDGGSDISKPVRGSVEFKVVIVVARRRRRPGLKTHFVHGFELDANAIPRASRPTQAMFEAIWQGETLSVWRLENQMHLQGLL